jgi:RNA polymerase sigma-70 factor (ECF subfamily)
MKNDEDLMKAYLDGDAAAFGEIYARYSGPLHRFLLRKARNLEDAGDLLQSSFLKFHRLRDKYRPDYPLVQWLYVIARSELLDSIRKNTSRQKLEKNWLETSQSEAAAPLESEEDWKSLLEDLSPEAREVLLARAVDEEDFQDIAARIGKQADTVRQIFSRSRKRLREGLRKKGA